MHLPTFFVILLFAKSVRGHPVDTDDGTRVADTDSGMVRGTVRGDYVAFLGIPYAAPPVGTNRFKAPLPRTPWHGIYEANREVMCPQRGIGDEDCLVANVFTPANLSEDPLPVLVYIHGGSFLMGSASTKGVEPLTKEGLIVVTINYRLGALGFLCLGTKEAPGNAGLKDQVAALKWVQRNIANFGGDPNQVTIYGMSAGGASVELLTLSPMAKGLFRSAIAESGSSTSVWVTDAIPETTAIRVAEALHFDATEKNKLAELYQKVPVDKLTTINFEYYNNLTAGTFGFVPCVEKLNTEAFMTESPYDILTNEKFEKVPMIFAFAAMEGLFLRSQEYYMMNYRERMESNFTEFLPADLSFDRFEEKQNIAASIKEFYFGNEMIGDENLVQYLNYFGDYLILHGLLNSVQIHARKGNPVYLMEFAYKGNLGGFEEFYSEIDVAGHGDVVKHVILRNPITTEADELTVRRVAKLISNFVKFGNPTPEPTDILPITWRPIQTEHVVGLYLDKDFAAVMEPHWDIKAYWDSLYSKYRRPITGAN